MIPSEKYNSMLGYHELEVLDAFDSPATPNNPIIRFLFQEWHRRAHKTTLFLNLMVREACKYPKSKYVYVAPTKVWARDIIWDDPNMIWDALPDKDEMWWKSNDDKMLITFGNGSMLKCGGSDKPDSIRGIDADGGFFDEWALHKKEVWGEIFRPIIAGKPKPGHRARWAAFAWTPKGCNHATQMFNNAANIESESKLPTKGAAKNCKPGSFASRLIADESGIISREELDKMLEEVEQGIITQAEYDQEMQCRRVTEEERTLITSAMLARLDEVEWEIYRDTAQEIRKIVAIDPAFGGDICAMKGFENGRELNKRRIKNPNLRTNDIIFEAKLMAEEIDTKNFIVDCIGVGKGVADGLADDIAGYDVQYFNSAGKVSIDKKQADAGIFAKANMYANKKAEAVAYAASLIRRLKVESVADVETKRQLVALSKYKVARNGKMLMIPNDDVKKDLGCSPDDGLCWIYGQWGLQYVDPESNEALIRYDEKMRDYRERKRAQRQPRSPMRMC